MRSGEAVLIPSHRHAPEDLKLWAILQKTDIAAYGERMKAKEQAALDTMLEFARKRCYIGVSWGKDSVVVAHLARQLLERDGIELPLAWIRVLPICNPDCHAVEDHYVNRFAPQYSRIDIHCRHDLFGYHATGTLEDGFAEARRRFGERHISGIRSSESSQRNLRMMTFGKITLRTCAPIGWWTARDVFCYLAHYDLPIHPAYAMLGGGRWDRERLRVASMGGKRGDGIGREQWEREYYGDVLNRLSG